MERFAFKRQLTMSRSSLSISECNTPIKTSQFHRRSSSSQSTPVQINLNPSELEELNSKIQKIQKHLSKQREEIVLTASTLTQQIANYSKRALNTLIEYEFEILTLQNSAKRGRPITSEKMLNVLNFFIPKEVEKLEIDLLLIEISKVFEMKNDEVGKTRIVKGRNELFCAKDYISGLIRIDLDTFQVNPVKFGPKVFPYSSVIPISKQKIFVTGGYTGSTSVSDAFVVDFNAKSYESFPSNVKRDAAAILMKGEKVFVFGGIEKKECSLDVCEYFDLNVFKWRRITSLPYPSHANTATLVEDRIFVIGFQLEHLLEYNEKLNKFHEVISLPGDCLKFVFENWIITPQEILEFDMKTLRWARFCFSSTLKFGWLFNHSSVKVDKFIYFIDDINGLLRLDTDQKKIDKIV
jgi:hypothetical protein